MPSVVAWTTAARACGSSRADAGQPAGSNGSVGKAARTRCKAALAQCCCWSGSSRWRTTAWTSRCTLRLSVLVLTMAQRRDRLVIAERVGYGGVYPLGQQRGVLGGQAAGDVGGGQERAQRQQVLGRGGLL